MVPLLKKGSYDLPQHTYPEYALMICPLSDLWESPRGGIEDLASQPYPCHNRLLSTSDSHWAILPYSFSFLTPVGASLLVYIGHAGTVHATKCSLASS